jgi:hypothetical protein
LKVERPERGTTVSVEVELMRDGPEGKVLRSFIKQVEVHVLPDGKVKCSPVLVPDEDADRTAKLPKEMKNPRSANFVRALHESLSQHGVQYQPDLGALPVSAVDQEKVRERFYELHNDGKSSPDTKLKAYGRALQDAQKSGYVDNRTDRKSGVTVIWVAYYQGIDNAED